jgi:nucleoside 2-deoxyribosyltransferase
MIVHFIGATSNLNQDLPFYREIIKIIHTSASVLARDWVEPAQKFAAKSKDRNSLDWQAVYQENIEALARADIVIAEATTKSFSTGFQVATAIQQKKPVLILTRNNALAGTFGSGISSDFVKRENYNLETLGDIVSDFINENSIDNKDLRFNFFIDRQIYNYLRWASYKSGKTKAEILRDLVLKEIKEKDY